MGGTSGLSWDAPEANRAEAVPAAGMRDDDRMDRSQNIATYPGVRECGGQRVVCSFAGYGLIQDGAGAEGHHTSGSGGRLVAGSWIDGGNPDVAIPQSAGQNDIRDL